MKPFFVRAADTRVEFGPDTAFSSAGWSDMPGKRC